MWHVTRRSWIYIHHVTSIGRNDSSTVQVHKRSHRNYEHHCCTKHRRDVVAFPGALLAPIRQRPIRNNNHLPLSPDNGRPNKTISINSTLTPRGLFFFSYLFSRLLISRTRIPNMLVSLTVGKVDAGVAVLLTQDNRLVSSRFPFAQRLIASPALLLHVFFKNPLAITWNKMKHVSN